jgi:ribosomal protein S18 acetylase RimI-like enzyme
VSAIGIRPATKADASEIALLVNIATHGGTANGWSRGDEAEGTYDPIEVGRLDALDESGVFNWRRATMAESDGEVVGMILGYREPDRPRPMPKDVDAFFVPLIELEGEAAGHWFISMLGVHVRWRGKGVGSRLLEVADRKKTETSAHGVALITEDVNAGAQRLYERHGYAVRATRPMAAWPGTEAPGKDWLLMAKD